jgi:flavin reductase (DIM6/NTAB) family NADH-FMN oxidoreductase RutF
MRASRTAVPYPRSDSVVQSGKFRHVLGHFVTGVVAVTAVDVPTGEPVGLAANSFTSVSLNLPLVAFCVARSSSSWPLISSADRILHQRPVRAAGGHQRPAGAARWRQVKGLRWSLSEAGAPMLDGSLAWLDVSIEQQHPAGDHMIVVAGVRPRGGRRTSPRVLSGLLRRAAPRRAITAALSPAVGAGPGMPA